MIVVGYEQKTNTDTHSEYIVFEKHSTKEDAESAMQTLQTNQAENDDLLLYFYGTAINDDDYKIMLVIMPDEVPVQPDYPTE